MSSQIQTRSLKIKSEKIETSSEQIEKLSLELRSLKTENKKLLRQVSTLQTKQLLASSNIDKWLNDVHIKSVFQSYSTYANQKRKDIVFIEPNTTQILKSSSLYDALQVLSSLNFEQANLGFFAISDYNQCNEKTLFQKRNPRGHNNLGDQGTHWSLLIFHRPNQTFYHLDSIKGSNTAQAKLVAKNVNCNYQYKELETPQQTSNFECGLHVLVNAKYVLDYALNQDVTFDELLKNLTEDTSYLNTTQRDALGSSLSYKSVATSAKKGGEDVHTTTGNESVCNLENSFIYVNSKLKGKKRVVTSQCGDDIECSNRFSALSLCSKPYESQTIDIVCSNNNNTSSQCRAKSKKLKSIVDIKQKTRCNTQLSIQSAKKNCDTLYHQIPIVSMNKNEVTPVQKEKKGSSRKGNKLKILADSHGRNVRSIVQERCNIHNVYSCIKPGGQIHSVLIDAENEAKDMDQDDFLVIFGGTNDIKPHLSDNFIPNKIEQTIEKCSHTNIIVSALPYRYDIPYLNRKIYQTNRLLKQLCDKYYHANFLPLNTIKRDDYSNGGLHFNRYGKSKYSQLLAHLIKDINSYRTASALIPVKINQGDFLGKRSPGHKIR